MTPASEPRGGYSPERLLRIDTARGELIDSRVTELSSWLGPGECLVVNDSATLPASLAADSGDEVRLARRISPGLYQAILFGPGSWKTPTEQREVSSRARVGERLQFGENLSARIEAVDPDGARLVTLRFAPGELALIQALYRVGRPIQYSYLKVELPLWSVQSPFAARPWSMEMPSAGRPLRWGILLDCLRQGIAVAPLTHAAGISSIGDPRLDAKLPLPERYEIPATSQQAIHRAREAGGRIVAVGTSVVRALESAALTGELAGETRLRIGPGHRLRAVDAVLSGMHVPGESHFELLEAFAPRALLERATRHAESQAYLTHELGDSCLIGKLG